jgi:hypothetical protein
LGRNAWILRENRVFRDLPTENIRSLRTMSDLIRTMSDLQFEFPETSPQTMSA